VVIDMADLLDTHGTPFADSDVWPHATLSDRTSFASRVFAGTNDECWIYCGGIEPLGGYGRWRPPAGNVTSTHRWSFVAHYGATDHPVIRHTCDVRCCANPHHLIDGTQAQNIRDTVERGAWRSIALAIWPARAFQLRTAAQAGDRDTVNALCARPKQLQLFKPAKAER
jgi:hypothetical protein